MTDRAHTIATRRSQRGNASTGDEGADTILYKGISAPEYKFITIKDNLNKLSESDLMRVYYYIADELIKTGDPLEYWFERGEQNRLHIHAVIKKAKIPENIKQLYAKFKNKKRLTYREEAPCVDVLRNDFKPCFIKRSIDLKSVNWKLTDFKTDYHLYQTINEYQYKDLCLYHDFIDSE